MPFSSINTDPTPSLKIGGFSVKEKFLVPGDLRMSQFMFVIRKRINIRPEQAIFIFCNGQILLNQSEIKDIYNKNKHEDNYLYLQYSGESTFG